MGSGLPFITEPILKALKVTGIFDYPVVDVQTRFDPSGYHPKQVCANYRWRGEPHHASTRSVSLDRLAGLLN